MKNKHFIVTQIFKRETDFEEIKLIELHNHIIVYQSSFYLAKLLEKDNTLKLIPINQKFKVKSENFYDFEYIGNKIHELIATTDLLESKVYSNLLKSLSNIISRRVSTSYKVQMNDPTLNKQQSIILKQLKFNIEGIQGPPGTGKSYLISRMIHSFDCCLVTAVTNKAIDSICEKFVNLSIPFFVNGNEDRLEVTAKQYTIVEQINQKSSVVQLKSSIESFNKRINKLKFELFQSNSFDSDNISDIASLTRNHSLFIGRTDGDIDRFMMLIDDLKDQIDNLKTSEAELQIMRQTYRQEIINDAKAIICTIDNIFSLMKNEDIDILTKISTIDAIIIDEAGCVPLTKIPILLMIPSVQVIIAIGDQKQLAPYCDIKFCTRKHGNPMKGRGFCDCQKFHGKQSNGLLQHIVIISFHLF